MNTLARLEAELRDDPALVDAILSRLAVLPPPLPEPSVVPIRSDKASVDLAIARAARLAINGIKSQIEFVN